MHHQLGRTRPVSQLSCGTPILSPPLPLWLQTHMARPLAPNAHGPANRSSSAIQGTCSSRSFNGRSTGRSRSPTTSSDARESSPSTSRPIRCCQPGGHSSTEPFSTGVYSGPKTRQRADHINQRMSSQASNLAQTLIQHFTATAVQAQVTNQPTTHRCTFISDQQSRTLQTAISPISDVGIDGLRQAVCVSSNQNWNRILQWSHFLRPTCQRKRIQSHRRADSTTCQGHSPQLSSSQPKPFARLFNTARG